MSEVPTDLPPKQFPSAEPAVAKRKLKSQETKNYNPNYIVPKKKPFKRYVFGGIGGLILLLIGLSFMPPYGTIRFGLCKTFVELNDPYPQFLEWVTAQESGMAVIIDYNRTDAFGQRTLNQIRCFFKEDPKTGLMLERININGDNEFPQEAKEYIDRFNIGIPSLIKTQPSLIMPRGQTTDVKNFR
jgi:hypothetical protein